MGAAEFYSMPGIERGYGLVRQEQLAQVIHEEGSFSEY